MSESEGLTSIGQGRVARRIGTYTQFAGVLVGELQVVAVQFQQSLPDLIRTPKCEIA